MVRSIFFVIPAVATAGVLRVPLTRQEKSYEQVRESLRLRAQLTQQLQSQDGNGDNNGPIQNFQDASYTGQITVGSNHFAETMVFDTGSSDLWVPGPKITTKGKHLYDHSKSSTYVANGKKFGLAYGSGPVSGFLSQDQVSFMGLTLNNYTFMEVEDVSGLGQLYGGTPMDGILGLAFSKIADGLVAPMEALQKSGQLSELTFAFYLTGDQKKGSELIFGGVDKAHYTGDFTYVDLNAETYWQVHLKSLKVGNDSILLPAIGTKNAIVDSGTSLLAGPPSDVKAMMQKLGAKASEEGLYAVDCDKVKTLPDVTFSLGGSLFSAGTPFSLKVEDMILQKQGNTCLLGVQPSPAPLWILGDVFMRQYYVQFDYAKNRIGIAQSSASSAAQRAASSATIVV